MNFEKYTPQDFQQSKLHAFKYLYIFLRKQELTSELLLQCDLDDPEDFKNKKPFIRAYEKLQQETGMTDEALSEALVIGMLINEYDLMINMNESELRDYIQEFETESEIPFDSENLSEDLLELWSGISEMLDNKKEQRNKFKEIINDNFDNKKEWPDSFPPYS